MSLTEFYNTQIDEMPLNVAYVSFPFSLVDIADLGVFHSDLI